MLVFIYISSNFNWNGGGENFMTRGAFFLYTIVYARKSKKAL